MKQLFITAALLLGLVLFGHGSYINAKAALAQYLIAQSWTSRSDSTKPNKPWPWADTAVVAKLSFINQQQDLYVFDTDSGQALAFGPGTMANSALPGAPGHSLLAGHRDTHFSVLQELQPGDELRAENYHGLSARYRVVATSVFDANQSKLPILDDDLLWLITCYPFDSLMPGGSLRYLVAAEKVAQPNMGADRITAKQAGLSIPSQKDKISPNQTKPPSQPLFKKA